MNKTTDKQIEALKLALEALKLNCSSQTESPATKAIAAIDEALSEQPAQQQEPVAWYDAEKDCAYTLADCEGRAQDDLEPLYLAQSSKPWVGLTAEEIERVCVPLGAAMLSFTEVARAIEAKLREKNTGETK